jgi:hypothetical protein
MCPEPPSFGALRLASHRDVNRIGDVAAAGFHYSEVFKFERPRHDQYWKDAVLSYRHTFDGRIRSPEYIVVVAEDLKQLDQDTSSTEVLEHHASPGERIVVAVASWRLEPGSQRNGKFKAPDGKIQCSDVLCVSVGLTGRWTNKGMAARCHRRA